MKKYKDCFLLVELMTIYLPMFLDNYETILGQVSKLYQLAFVYSSYCNPERVMEERLGRIMLPYQVFIKNREKRKAEPTTTSSNKRRKQVVVTKTVAKKNGSRSHAPSFTKMKDEILKLKSDLRRTCSK